MHPRLFQLGHLVLPTYGILVALGVLAALALCLHLARLLVLDPEKIWNLAVMAIATALVSARLLLAATLWRQYGVRAWMASLNQAEWPLLCGVALSVAVCCWYAWRVHLPIRRSADALAPALALGFSAASIGCLEAGCDYGTPTRAPWAIVFRSPYCAPGTPLGVPLHPTQIYASLAQFAIFVCLLWLLHRPHRDGEIMGAWLFLSGLGDFFLMFLRGDAMHSELFGGLLTVTQLIAIGMVVLGGALWLRRSPAFEARHAG